jgi:hypothetical protein
MPRRDKLYSQYEKTHTAKYFMGLYGQSTLHRAIEVAAVKTRQEAGLLLGFDGFCKVPVDVENIAKQRNITLGKDLHPSAEEDALFSFSENIGVVKLNRDRPETRIRLTLAHEICHKFFYQKNGVHQIGLPDIRELKAEEKICTEFAGALLMPYLHVQNFLRQIPNDSPGKILAALEDMARCYKVSMPALIARIGQVSSPSTFFGIVLCLKYMNNLYTNSDAQLRVAICPTIGGPVNFRTWRNRTAKGVNLQSVETLYVNWKERFCLECEPIGGRYSLNPDGEIIRITQNHLMSWMPEKVNLSVLEYGKWHNQTFPVLTISCLYAARGWKADKAYIISILKPQ